jgi:hypothetical protein
MNYVMTTKWSGTKEKHYRLTFKKEIFVEQRTDIGRILIETAM